MKSFIDTLFKQLKNIEYSNVEKVFLDINFEYFKIIPLIKGKVLYPIVYNIPLYKFIDDKKMPKLEFTTLWPRPLEKIPMEFDMWENHVDNFKIANKIFNMDAIPFMIYYLKQLNDLTELEDKNINHAVLENFILIFSRKISEIFQDAINSNEFLISKLREEIEYLSNSTINNEEYEIRVQDIKDVFNIFEASNDILQSLMDGDEGNINISLNLGNEDTIDKLDELEFKVNQLNKNFIIVHAYFSNKWISEFFSLG